MIEPEDGALVRTGEHPEYEFHLRDDQAAQDGDWDDDHWWNAADQFQDPESWEQIQARTRPQRLFTMSEAMQKLGVQAKEPK